MNRQFKAIHQFHSGATPGDAITNQMFALQSELRSMGYKSDIFAEHFDGELSNVVKHVDYLTPSADELLLIHHSMGHRRLDQILEFPNPIVTVYHNITPAQELAEVGYKHFSHIGRQQLDVLAQQSLMGVADSNYNRKEMLLRGFKHVEVIPVRTDFREFQSTRTTRNEERDWLFVGRIAPNKQQIEIVRAFHHFHHNIDKSARLFLVGDHKMRSYVDEVGKEIEKLDLVSSIDAAGKLEDVDLIQRYARAGVFVSLSRHEGFGVPLLEAMAMGIPVVALESSAVTETMGGAGLLLQTSQPEVVSEAVRQVMTDRDFRNDIIWKQDRRLEKLTNFDVRAALTRVLDHIAHRPKSLSVQVQGPIESSYSLAILNRETAFQLASHTEFDISVYPTEGLGDYPPHMVELEAISGLSDLYKKGLVTPYPDVVIRQMFPPRVKDTTGSNTLQYFGWEESLVPHEYVRDFNEHVHRIMTMSSFVKEALKNSGVTVPIDVVGVGVRTPLSDSSYVIEELQELKRIRLLHISSAFPRKGVDVLLNAYFDEFSSDDDITLILKTFPNQHNIVEEQLSHLVKNHLKPPHVVFINRDLPVNCLGNLYEVASAYVHTARGEGFGLPVAEAMLSEVPVISTATSGLADFVDETTATVIPSFPVNADTHVSVPGSQWFEPDVPALRIALRSLFSGIDASQRQTKAKDGKLRIERDFSWEAVGKRVQNSILLSLAEVTPIRVTHLTTFNSRCGIAEYSSLLQQGLPKNVFSRTIADRGVWPIDLDTEEDIVRLWEQLRHQDVGPLVTSLQLSNTDVIHLQYNFGFFSMEDLSSLIDQLHHTKPIVITLHRTKDLDRGHEIVSLHQAKAALQKVDAIIVHEQHDVDRLIEFGISDNVHLIPHAAMPFVGERSNREYLPSGELRIGTFGFLLPHKGLEASLSAVHLLNQRGIKTTLKALCALHPDPSSAATHQRVKNLIAQLSLSDLVNLDTKFRTTEEIHSELSDVDVLVLPYSQTEESSSGVLAMLLGIGKPIIATELDIFSGARNAVTFINAPTVPDQLANAIQSLILQPEKIVEFGKRANQRSIDISWGAIGRETTHLYQSVLRQ